MVFRLTGGVAAVGEVSENSEGIPEHRRTRIRNKRTFKSGMQFTKEETRNLPKTAPPSKVVCPFTRALEPLL
jgi:hypothetical protein